MAYDRFLIAPINTGWETDLKPWLIPDDAFSYLQNAYVFRGRVRKRFGSKYMGNGSGAQAQLFSRLSIPLGSTDGAGDLAGMIPGTVIANRIGMMFSIGTEIFTVYLVGSPGVMKTTGASTTHTYDTTSGAFVFAGAAINTPVYFYPALPVQGLAVYENGPPQNQPSFAFDTQFAYTFDAAGTGKWIRSESGGNPVFHGDTTRFFYSSNWQGAIGGSPILYVTNYNASVPVLNATTPDPMWTYSTTGGWVNLTPFTNTGTVAGFTQYVQTARIILPFKNRLLLINTIEVTAANTTQRFAYRVRYSAQGSAFSTSAWVTYNQSYTVGGPITYTYAGGGFVDCTTSEAIIGAEFIKDHLIIFFERSTWELVYTGNQITPFLFQKLNTELGAESTFSVVPFDKVVLAIGNTGVHACNGSNVERIDNKIPDEVFNIFDQIPGTSRVCGIRDYFTEMVYWAFPSVSQIASQSFPRGVLVYNYKNNAWALNDDTITAFGYFEQQVPLTLQNWNTQLQQSFWQLQSAGPSNNNAEQVIAGNQEGFVTLISPDISRNAGTRQVTNITLSGTAATLTIIDHMFIVGDYIALETMTGTTGLSTIYQVNQVPNSNTVIIDNAPFLGTYLGGGTAALVSQIVIDSKQWNPYVNQDRNFYLAKIDFAVQKTANGQVTVDYFPNASSVSLVKDGIASNAIVGNNILETTPYTAVPFEKQQARLWHPIYFQGDGECIQIQIFMSDTQTRTPSIAWSDFQLEGMVLYTVATSSRQH